MNVLNDILKVSRDIIMREPFYGVFLSTLNRLESDQVPIAGVRKNGINMELGVNPDTWPLLTYNARYGVLKHELLHICFAHPIMRDMYADKKLFNIAADIEVNQYIDNKYFEGLEPVRHTDFGFPDKQGTDWYYKELQKMKGNNPLLDQLLESMQCDGHGSWQEIEESAAVDKKLMQKQIEHQLRESHKITKNRGTLPGAIQEILDKIVDIQEPVLDWKAFFRRFAGYSTKYFTKKSKRKLSNRFEDAPGLKIKHKNHIFVAVDTSGSVSNAEFNEFMDQIHHIYKSGTTVTIGHADSDMAHVEEYRGKKIADRFGNGGTDFDPAIEYFNKHKTKFTSMVYFTDGECVPPKVKPHKPLLWIISSSGKKLETLPGIKIQIPNKK
jgi:predicted metal-dependent peptidase